jgi:dihydrofolate synthase/folylpolyglutamate synthase
LDDWLTFIGQQHSQTIDMGLDRMHIMLDRLDLRRPAPKIITVAGTNGKGSTCVAIEQLLMANGTHVGATLSPHIRRFNERIRIDGCEVTDAVLTMAFADIERVRAGLALTYFEFSALAALWCFRAAQVQVGILEIGLGGRLDAFNALDADIAVITSIGLDHQEYLGDTLEQIGIEKAGILRSDQSVVLGQDLPGAVHDECRRLGLEPKICGQDFSFDPSQVAGEWTYLGPDMQVSLAAGSVAAHNIALALTVTSLLVAIDVQRCRDIAPRITLPGRMQQIVIDERTYVFDVCHNPAGARFCCAEMLARGLRPHLVLCAMLRDKAHRDVREAVSESFSAPWVLFGTFGDRALSSHALAQSMDVETVCVEDFQAARTYVRSASAPNDVIFVFGSFNAVEQGIMVDQDVGTETLTDSQRQVDWRVPL